MATSQWTGLAILLLASLTHAYPFFPVDRPELGRRGPAAGARTNDVICSMRDWQGNAQFPPPVVVTYPDGSTSCGCSSDIVQGGNGSYTQCNQIYPTFGQTEYADPGLRQNACYLDDNYVAVCATSCTPNTSPNDDGTCRPTNPDSYSLQSPTTEFGTATASATDGGAPPPATTTTENTWTQDWTDSSSDDSSTWTESDSVWEPSSSAVPSSTSAASDVPTSSSPSSTSASLAGASVPASLESSAASRLSLGACSVLLFAGLCI